jgi:uncharacterized membrane protein
MKKVLRFIWSIVELVIIAYVILITSFILCRNKYGYTQIGDYTFNNIALIDERNIEDTKKGDLLVVKNTNDIKKGDRIYYYAAYNEVFIVRSDYVVSIESDDYSSLYTIERNGEKLTIANTRVLGKYSNTYSNLGAILDVLESRVGFLFLVLLPIMIVFIYQVYEFVMILRYEDVNKEDRKRKDDSVDDIVKEAVKDAEEKVDQEIL